MNPDLKLALVSTAICFTMTGCASNPKRSFNASQRSFETSQAPSNLNYRIFRDGSTPALLDRAEAKATPAGAKVLAMAREMTVENEEIIKGSCWDYLDAVWNRAGYPMSKRKTVFKGKKKGPHAKASQVKPGDWLYFMNHTFSGREHSGLFVAWDDKGDMKGYTLSYPGDKRAEPARYLIHDLSGIYRVIRAE